MVSCTTGDIKAAIARSEGLARATQIHTWLSCTTCWSPPAALKPASGCWYPVLQSQPAGTSDVPAMFKVQPLADYAPTSPALFSTAAAIIAPDSGCSSKSAIEPPPFLLTDISMAGVLEQDRISPSNVSAGCHVPGSGVQHDEDRDHNSSLTFRSERKPSCRAAPQQLF